tara:strand:+ start:540 stop:1322 length:783 start_codon:yes stop_codon:yes gene_type:complete
MTINKFVTTIEARMTSSRLPGKVLTIIENKFVLEILVNRIQRSKYVDEIIIATTLNNEDDPIVELAKNLKVKYFRGSENDVLGRLAGAIQNVSEEHIIQLTGDNPIIDSNIIDYMADYYLESDFDFVTNNGLMNMKNHYLPLGMDISLFKKRDLINIEKKTNDPEDREHPTLYFYRTGKNTYKIKNLHFPEIWKNKNNYRLTLDTEDDLYVISKICENFKDSLYTFKLEEMYSYLEKNPDISNKNINITHRIPTGLNDDL